MHGKGPIYVELHCTVMARRAPLLFAQIFLELEDLFHHHKKYCERRGNQDYRRVTCLSQLSFLYFCVGSLCSLRSRSFGKWQLYTQTKKTKKTMRIVVRKPCISLLVFLLRQLFIFKKPRKPAILVRKPYHPYQDPYIGTGSLLLNSKYSWKERCL